jgi:hypothetical protein
MMGEDPARGWPEVREYVPDDNTQEVENAFEGDVEDHQDWNSGNANNHVLDQYHDVEQMFRDAHLKLQGPRKTIVFHMFSTS